MAESGYNSHTIGAFKYETKDIRPLITPEGVSLNVRLADIGARIGAFTIDIIVLILALWIFAAILQTIMTPFGASSSEVTQMVMILIAFLLRFFYFTFFEILPRAATPGKMLLKLRIADRRGGQLSAASVFVRNAMRELEFFLPLGMYFQVQYSEHGDVSGFIGLLGLIWSGIFLLLPLFNKNRLRAGDLLAGTWVVQNPKPLLLSDLTESAPKPRMQFNFTEKQLAAYGIHELHVLEDIIRIGDIKTILAVADRIRNKIGWEKDADESARDFLNAYYAGLRKTLETQMAFGKKKKNKFDTDAQ